MAGVGSTPTGDFSDDEIQCGKVYQSSRVYGFSIVACRVWLTDNEISNAIVNGWQIMTNTQSDYLW